MRELTFGYSPCPNDTFAFHALAHGLTNAPFRIRPVLLDIEELNRRARNAEFDLTKLSIGAMPAVGHRYRMLRSGAALGHGVGPLVVARSPMSLAEAVRSPIAIPGQDTTAWRLLRLAANASRDGLSRTDPERDGLSRTDPERDGLSRTAASYGGLSRPGSLQPVEMRYDRILRAVADGHVSSGLIIHESRFTYADHGLVKVADLGEWWEAETGMPVPLAAICARADLDPTTVAAAEAAIRESVQHAFDHPADSRDYVRLHAQEMSDDVCAAHIELYVNQFSLDIGEAGQAAIQRLVSAA